MKFSTMFPGKYLRAGDLHGKSVTAVIESVAIEDVGGRQLPEDMKPVMRLRGKNKSIVLNKTNGMVLAEAYGDETDNWAGQEVEIYPDRVTFQGRIVDAIRVRVQQPAPAQHLDDAPFDDDINF